MSQERKFMNLFKLMLLILLFINTALYAKNESPNIGVLYENSESTPSQLANIESNTTQDDVKALWKIFSPILLLGILLLISHYVQRQYNKKLKKQVILNIEELRAKDEVLIQKQRMADMGEMLSLIAHQWRQPLAAINSAILGINIKIESGQFNLDDPADQQRFIAYLKKKHNNITDYVRHLSTTTDDFRNFFNPNKNKEIKVLTLPIEAALKLVESSMQQKGIEIVRDLQVNPEFNMYQNEIMQVVLNLLKNSEYNFLEKHTNDPKITVSTFLRSKKTVISICDNGGGIAPKIIKKIFEPYFSTKNDKHGTGLGLYMSRTIMESHHNGSLAMINRNDGVCFELIFPMPK
jgi:signal transduction histidine kinase